MPFLKVKKPVEISTVLDLHIYIIVKNILVTQSFKAFKNASACNHAD